MDAWIDQSFDLEIDANLDVEFEVEVPSKLTSDSKAVSTSDPMVNST